MTKTILLGLVLFMSTSQSPAAGPPRGQAEDDQPASPAKPQGPTVDADGTVHIPAFEVPLSSYMSAVAKRRFIDRVEQAKKLSIDQAKNPSAKDRSSSASITKSRERVDNELRPAVERAKAHYPVNVEEQKIGGVRTHIITPRDGVSVRNRDRVLINLHGGGFQVGAVWHGIAESIPVSGVGKFKIITVDYRMAPEYKFPAASEDVASVYRELLKQYKAEGIGIYGCSAGGVLSAMAVAWFQKEKLPAPGAIGIFGAAAFGDFYSPVGPGSWGGDSPYTAPALIGGRPLQLHAAPAMPPDAYLSNVDLANPLVSPALSPAVLAKFPPTLLITGTRAFDMSAAVQTQRELTKAGVEADLHLWDGMGHCFFLDDDVPESQEAYDVMAKFFDKHLGRP